MAGRWDELRIHAYEGEASANRLVQDGQLAAMRPPEDILARGGIDPAAAPDGSFVFCGTVPRLAPHAFARCFAGAIHDERSGRSLRVAYDLRVDPAHGSEDPR